MKNKKNIVICLLFVTNLVLGVLFYHTQKELDNFVEKVQIASMLFSVDSLDYDIDIKHLEGIESDSTIWTSKENVFQELMSSGEMSNTGFKLFTLVIQLRKNEKNDRKLVKLQTDYGNLNQEIDELLRHYDLNSNFKDITTADVDTLISDYKKLKDIVVQLEKIKIEP